MHFTAHGYLQLKELSHLILGIRVFNWDIGKGGAGISDIPKQISDTVGELEKRLQAQVDNTTEVCDQYVDVLVAPSGAIEASGESDAATLQGRWKDELANRRQLAAFLTTVSDDLHEDKQRYDSVLSSFRCVGGHLFAPPWELCALTRLDVSLGLVWMFRLELDDVKRLVAGRSSVPKEQVYPKFHSMATYWLQLQVCSESCSSRRVHSTPSVPHQGALHWFAGHS